MLAPVWPHMRDPWHRTPIVMWAVRTLCAVALTVSVTSCIYVKGVVDRATILAEHCEKERK